MDADNTIAGKLSDIGRESPAPRHKLSLDLEMCGWGRQFCLPSPHSGLFSHFQVLGKLTEIGKLTRYWASRPVLPQLRDSG